MDRSEVRTEIRRSIKDNDPDPQRYRWTDIDLNARINIAQRKIAAETQSLEGRIVDDIQSGISEYSLPDVFLKDLRVLYKNSDGDYKRLKKISQEELDNYASAWRDSQSEIITHYSIRHNTILIIYPTPNFNRTDGLKLDIIKQPDDLTADTDKPFDGSNLLLPFQDSIVLEVARQCLSDEGKTELASIKIAELKIRITAIKSIISEQFEGMRVTNIYEVARHRNRRTK
jgi:hypothetical protein